MPQIKTTGGNELLTVKQVAERLKVSPYTVRSWIQKGLLQALRLNMDSPKSQLRIRANELEKILVRAKVREETEGELDTEHIPSSSTGDPLPGVNLVNSKENNQ